MEENSPMLVMVKDQLLAYLIMFFTGIIISGIMWKMFMSADGAEINNLIYWIISLIIWFAPQLALWSKWNLSIKPQYKAQIIIRSRRQSLWLPEGSYIIPFFKLLFDINVSEIHKTSKID